jgi:hypothetical protein
MNYLHIFDNLQKKIRIILTLSLEKMYIQKTSTES